MYNSTRNQQQTPRRGGRHQTSELKSATIIQQWPPQQLPFPGTFYYSTNPMFGGPYDFSIPPPPAFSLQTQHWTQSYDQNWDQNFAAQPSAMQHMHYPYAPECIPSRQQDYGPPEPQHVTSARGRSANPSASGYYNTAQTQHQYQRNTNRYNQMIKYSHQEDQSIGAQYGRSYDTKKESYDQKRSHTHLKSEDRTKSKMDSDKLAKALPTRCDIPNKQKQVAGTAESQSRQSTKLVSNVQSSNSMRGPRPDQDSEGGQVVVLDRYNSDLYLTIAKDGLLASTTSSPIGFSLLWGGARASHGARRGKVMFEVRISQYLDSKLGDGFSMPHPNLVSVGWSKDSPNFSLGETEESYGYDGLGKRSHDGVFGDYGEPFGPRDVITALLDLDGPSKTVSYMKNGRNLGVAHTLPKATKTTKHVALFPHVSCRNAKVEVNFGKKAPWAHIPKGYTFIGHLPVEDRVSGLQPPKKKSACEVIAMIGLPGCGKTTWALQKQKDCPQKRYNILGTDDLIEKFNVHHMRPYSERFKLLYKKANNCFNELLKMASQHHRNYILDQTNLYQSARKRKMAPFKDFLRVAVVIQPDIDELEARASRGARETGKSIPPNDLMEMKANYTLPSSDDGIFNRIMYVELDEPSSKAVVKQFNRKTFKDW